MKTLLLALIWLRVTGRQETNTVHKQYNHTSIKVYHNTQQSIVIDN